jgi:AcrR family transcriptional regulator
MKFLVALLIACAPLVPAPVAAQEVSESVKQTCRAVAERTARTIVYALRANIDPATQVKKVPDSWLEGVQAHMLLAASRAPHLSEDELAALGYGYCVSRRPADR